MRGFDDFPSQLFLSFAVGQRSSAMNQLVDKNAKRPDISLGPIQVIYQPFRTHIKRASNGYILEDLVRFDSKSKVAEFISILMDKNIRYFKITVDDAETRKVMERINDRHKYFRESLLVDLPLFGKQLIKISMTAQFCDDIAVVNTGVYIQAPDNIGVIDDLKYTNLTIQQPTSYFTLDISYSNLLNCHGMICQEINPAIYLTETTLSYLFTKVEHVVLDFLHDLDPTCAAFLHQPKATPLSQQFRYNTHKLTLWHKIGI